MDLLLLRHARAEQHAASGHDPDRALTPDGIALLRGVLTRAQSRGISPVHIVASPYLRARQTAQLAADLLQHPEPILTSPRLIPDSSPEELWAEARELADSPLLFVAHEPLLSSTAAWLLGESRAIIEFRPATLAAFSFPAFSPAPRGQLLWKIDAT